MPYPARHKKRRSRNSSSGANGGTCAIREVLSIASMQQQNLDTVKGPESTALATPTQYFGPKGSPMFEMANVANQ